MKQSVPAILWLVSCFMSVQISNGTYHIYFIINFALFFFWEKVDNEESAESGITNALTCYTQQEVLLSLFYFNINICIRLLQGIQGILHMFIVMIWCLVFVTTSYW